MMRRALKITAVVLALVTVSGAAAAGYVWWHLATIPTFDETLGTLAPAPASTAGPKVPELLGERPDGEKVFLVFSVGSEGLDPGDGVRIGIGTGRARMADGLTDSLMLVVANPSTRRIGVVSIPRDTWLPERGHRINESLKRHGLSGLADDLESLTGLRPDHAISVNFAAFADLTDAVGGVDVYLPYAVNDAKAMLDLPAGCVHMDGPDALSFVRSRHWRVLKDGVWRYDATSSDWGRIERQQSFLRIVLAKMLSPQLPLRVPALLGVAGDNVVIDAELSVAKMLGWAGAFASGVDDLAAATVPGRGFTTPSGAQVIGVDPVGAQRTAQAIVDRVRGTDPTEPAAMPSGTATPSPVPSTKPSTSFSWRPDNGNGQGGMLFRSCTAAERSTTQAP